MEESEENESFHDRVVRTGGYPVYMAHRGGGLGPENTMHACRLSAQHWPRIRVLEVDIRLTRDKRLVLMHDSSVDRTTDGQGAVCDLLLSEVRQLNAAHCFAELPAMTVPTLEEFLEEFVGSATRYSPDLLFMFDFKDEASIEQAWPLIQSYPALRKRYILGAIFESPNALLREKRISGTPIVTDIAQTFALTIAYNTGLWSLYEFGQHDIFGYVLQSHSPTFLTKGLIDALHAKGMRVMVCGPLLAQRHVLERYIECGADYIMIDSIETAGK